KQLGLRSLLKDLKIWIEILFRFRERIPTLVQAAGQHTGQGDISLFELIGIVGQKFLELWRAVLALACLRVKGGKLVQALQHFSITDLQQQLYVVSSRGADRGVPSSFVARAASRRIIDPIGI